AMDTYLGAGWDFVGERANGTGETWQMRQAGGYPRLSLFEGYEHTQPQGRGTLTEPFLITSAEELGSVRYRPLDCYRLEGDVDLSGVTWGVAVAPWFGGHFDGNGHVIRHLSIQGGGFLGLFGGLDYDSVVWDLGLANASVEGTSDAIGALAGDNHATVTSCYSTGAVTGNDDVGGLIGLNYGIVSDCYSTSAASGDIYAGGLIGDNDGDVSNCYSAGEITRASTDRRGGPFAGGLVGSNYEGSVVNCFWDTETSGVASGIYGVGLTTAEMQELTRYLEAGWDFAGESDNGTTETWQMPPEGGHPRLSVFKGYEAVVPEGQGTRAEPFLIRTAAELGSIGHRPLACYRLANDIDLSEMTWSAAPIKWFGGHFDGDGHVVRGLQVEGASLLGLFGTLAADAVITNLDLEGGSVTGRGWYVGFLVGRNDGTVITCHTTGDVSGEHRLIGGLVGYNCRGSVSDCYSAGAVTGGDWAIGGLVGYNWGGMSNCSSSGEVMGEDVIGGLVGNNGGRVSSGWASGAVTGDGNVGGLVGVNWGTVSNCYGAGAVAGNDEVGGLIGGNGGTVWNCYSTGVVAGDDAIGGLVGDNDHGDVLNCYSVGAVSGIGDTGGLVGEGSGRVTNSFWDVEASGVEHSGGGTGLTTAEMMDPEWVGLQGWAGNPDWVLDPHLDYPRLAWEVTGGQIIPAPVIDWMVGDGTSETPYEIHNVSQFVTITKASLLRQKRLVLMADLDLAQLAWPQAPLPDFGGTLDGNGHAIRNLTISGSSYLGLVRRLEEGGAIVNLGLVDVNVAGTGARIGALVGYNVRGIVLNCHSVGVVTGDRDVGGLVGDNFRGSVSDCYSGCVVSGTSPVGGLVGNNNGSVTHCHSFGQTTATGLGYAGGLVGYNWGDVSNSYSLGEVTGGRWFSDAGGLIGYNGGTVSDCHSTATVRGEDTVGGLIAHNRDYYASVTNCFSAGVVVTDGWDAGGLIGNNHYAKVSKCYSTSVVTGNRDVGGLVGENHLGDVSDCYSSGSVTGRNGVGGLVGRNLGSLTNCYSTSVIVGIGDLGGLVGRSGGKATAEGSFWDMDTSGQDYSAGGMGLTTGEMQTASTYLVAGWDFLGEVENGVEDIWWIEDGRDYPHLWWEPTGVNAAVGADLPGEG
ncbi:MAG: GLUG motif-containing protein, partial [Planctomycetota bacterium]